MSRDNETMQEDDLNKLMNDDPAFEAKLAQAMQLDVPELDMPELPDIDAANVVPLGRGPKKMMWFAMAATVALAAFLGFQVGNNELGGHGEHSSGGTLEEQVLAHLDGEPASYRITDERVPDDQLVKVVPANLATMNHDAGLITYAMSCHINGKDVPHLVVQGEKGPITILLMPHEKVDGTRELEGENIHGFIIPVGDGSIAIVGGKGEALDRVRQNVVDSVSWST
ncbi:MAG: DUF3379 family protein [Pseudomonadota bacterium]